jgi:hypothetical protein
LQTVSAKCCLEAPTSLARSPQIEVFVDGKPAVYVGEVFNDAVAIRH